ncbi:MAG: helix-turn-helix transcriptional regulator [Acidobacteriota bacterium]
MPPKDLLGEGFPFVKGSQTQNMSQFLMPPNEKVGTMKINGLKEKEVDKGFNASSLANLMGVTPSTVSRWASGEASPHYAKQEASLDMLYRAVVKASKGNEEAKTF